MKVYDLLNAGPRHRFLIRNKSGEPLLVSNCTQGIAADFMSHGARNAEKKGMEPFALVHDQGLCIQPEGKTAEDFEAALGDLPTWAKGFPMKVECKATPYYTK